MDSRQSRELWHVLEPINAVSYFCAETRGALTELGCKGFWMGYFGGRAAPMGPVGAGTVEATFFNFHPARVGRAIPDVWTYAQPEAIVTGRCEAAAASLRRLLSAPAAEKLAAVALPALDAAIEHGSPAGKPLFGANRRVEPPADPVAALWQAATTLREHRGDCHVDLLASAGLDGLDALVLFALSEGIGPAMFRDARGWSDDEWGAALEGLAGRGFATPDGALSEAGRDLRSEVERRTDELSAQPYEVLSDAARDDLVLKLRPAAQRVAGSGEIQFPNPIGLPRP